VPPDIHYDDGSLNLAADKKTSEHAVMRMCMRGTTHVIRHEPKPLELLGLIRTTFAAVPRRWAVLTGKAAVCAAAALTAGER
jgi:hypothetical protein